MFRIGYDDLIQIIDTTSQIVAQSLVRRVDIGWCRGVAQVSVDYQHFFSFDGKAHGNVHGQKRFAAARIEWGHDDDIRSLVLAGHKFQVGTQYAECLVDDVTVALLDDNGLDFLRFLS